MCSQTCDSASLLPCLAYAPRCGSKPKNAPIGTRLTWHVPVLCTRMQALVRALQAPNFKEFADKVGRAVPGMWGSIARRMGSRMFAAAGWLGPTRRSGLGAAACAQRPWPLTTSAPKCAARCLVPSWELLGVLMRPFRRSRRCSTVSRQTRHEKGQVPPLQVPLQPGPGKRWKDPQMQHKAAAGMCLRIGSDHAPGKITSALRSFMKHVLSKLGAVVPLNSGFNR